MRKKIVHRVKGTITIDKEVATRYKNLVVKINKLQKELEPLEKTLKSELIDIMEEIGESKVNSNGINASLKQAYIQNKFDTTRFKKEKNNLYIEYLKSTNVSSSVSLTLEN